MADLPQGRLELSPPFTYVSVDVFGPWYVVLRRTRGGQSRPKRWASLFTCLVTRAIHIEVLEEMTSSSFINALRRFTSIRGPVKEFRSDRGTNFVGCTDAIGIDAINVEDAKLTNHLFQNETCWKFNPPHASHMGGVWERMIGTTRRILDSMLLDMKGKELSHEVLITLVAEVAAIVNSRPIVAVSMDPDAPQILSPSMSLTQKSATASTCQLTELDLKDSYRSQWKQVQYLANTFWEKWKQEYLTSLQARPKWRQERPNLKSGDIVIMRDAQSPRIEWPLAIVQKTFPSDDGKVRKVEVAVCRHGERTTYIRPITQLVPLISTE